MSDRAERIFAWVWRINGLLLLALAVVGTVAVLALVVDLGIFNSREYPAEQLRNVAGADIGAHDLKLGSFQAIAGTDLLYAPLASPSEYVASGSISGLGAVRNLLFFDTSTKRAHWLLPGNEQTLPSYRFLLDPPNRHEWAIDAEKPDQEAIAILLEIRKDATRGASSRSIAVASPDGRGLTRIANATDGMLGHHSLGRESVLVFYVAAGAARVLDLDPVARKVRSDGPLCVGD